MDILTDEEIRKVLGTIIIGGDVNCIRPNSYILRLGADGEFLNVGKNFELGKGKKGLRLQPGHSLAMTALEGIDFRPETVEKHFPNCGLHGLITPTTDLAREGVVCPTGQVDCGYSGTLNWTVTNTSGEERKFLFKERLVRLTIFKLSANERPAKPYDGDYQQQVGYVRSSRKGPPAGMQESEWEDARVEGSAESFLDNLMKAGYPWHALGRQLKILDEQFQTVTNEYGDIRDRVDKIAADLDSVKARVDAAPTEIREAVRAALHEDKASLQNRSIVATVAAVGTVASVVAGLINNQVVSEFVKANEWVWPAAAVISLAIWILATRKPKRTISRW